jgi:hypothetical protein
MIPVHTTIVEIERRSYPDADASDYTVTAVWSGIPAHLSAPSQSGSNRLGKEVVEYVLLHHVACGALTNGDLVTDTATGQVWFVLGGEIRRGLGLGHGVARVRRAEGHEQ